MSTRKSKRIHWELMLQLEEAGEEDICSLFNQVMGAQPYFGSGDDLAEYLDALTALEAQGELRVREYRNESGRTVFLSVVTGMASRPAILFRFDPNERIWRWTRVTRQMVELPDN
jgi:hypothetical protein